MFDLPFFLDPREGRRWSPDPRRRPVVDGRRAAPPRAWRGGLGRRHAEASAELRLVHVREHTRLLLCAAGLRLRRRRDDVALTPFPVAPVSLRTWRRRARRARHLLALDGIDLSAGELIERLLRLHPRDWPRAATLTRAALEAGAGSWGELCHGHVLLRRGALEEAEESFRSLLDQDPPPPLRWRAYEGLAAVHAGAGRSRLAMGAMEAAAEEPACGVGPLACGFYLALLVRDSRRCRRAAARLDLLVRADEPAFVATLGRLRAHARRVGRGVRRSGPDLPAADEFGLTPDGRSPAERLLRALT